MEFVSNIFSCPVNRKKRLRGLDQCFPNETGYVAFGAFDEGVSSTEYAMRIGVSLNGAGVPLGEIIAPRAGGGQGISLFTGTNQVESIRLTSTSFFKASNYGAFQQAGLLVHEFNSDQNTVNLNVYSGNTGSNVVGFSSDGVAGFSGTHFAAAVDGNRVFRVQANGDVQNSNNVYGAISDIKLKENIAVAPSYWDRHKLLQWVLYTLKDGDPDQKLLGLIAQATREVFPGLITSTPDMVAVEKTRPVDRFRLVYDDKGEPLMDADGQPVLEAYTDTETYTEMEPTGEVTLSVKYSVLYAIAAVVLQEAQHRIEAVEQLGASLLSRVEALEAA